MSDNKPLNILLIGELCHDITRDCTIARLSPEAPIPILCPVSTFITEGMAGNVRSNLYSLGGIENNITFISNVTKPILKTRYIDEQTGYIVARVDENDKVGPFTEMDDVISALLRPSAQRFDVVVISDYHKGLLHESQLDRIISAAKKAAIPVFMDTKKVLGYWSKGCTVVKINQREYEHNLAKLDEDEMPYDWCDNLVITKGSQGATLMRKQDTPIHIDVEPVAVADVTGAGDTHLAALVLAYLTNGGNLVKAIEYANDAARIAVSKRGTVAVRADEISLL